MSRFVVVAVIFALLIGLIGARPADSRTIAVVYDDSGSMFGQESTPFDLRFAYASYSLQTMRALLSKEDRLVVAFMNDNTFHSSKDPARDIATIEARSYAKPQGSTPYETVNEAMDLLQAEKSEKDRWLIIITDGGFNRVSGNLASQIGEFQKKVPGVKVICFGIASGAHNPVFRVWQTLAGAMLLDATPSRDIRGKLQQVAATVTANSSGSGITPTMKGEVLTFTSPFPLTRFTVLQQAERAEDLAQVVSAEAGATRVQVSAGVATRTPKVDPQLGTPSPLFGLVHHLQPAVGKVVPEASEIRLRLSKALPSSVTLTILPEVAVKLRVSLSDQSGAEITPSSGKVFSACKDRPVTINAALDFGAANSAAAKQLSAARVTFYYDGKATPLSWQSSSGTFVGSVMVGEGVKPIRTAAEYQGYLNIQDTGQLQGLTNCVPRRVTLSANGVSPDGVWSADVRELSSKGATPLEIVPQIDGRAISKEELKQWSCVAESPAGVVEVVSALSAQGWSLVPKQSWCTSCATPTGTFPVRVVYNGKELNPGVAPAKAVTVRIAPPSQVGSNDQVVFPAPLTFEIKDPGLLRRCWKLIAAIFVVLIAVVWIVGLVVKSRFAKGALVVYERQGGLGRRSSLPLSTSFISRHVIPYFPETSTIESIKFKAGKNHSHILLAKDSLQENITKGGDAIANRNKDLRVNKNETVEQRISQNVLSVYRYEL